MFFRKIKQLTSKDEIKRDGEAEADPDECIQELIKTSFNPEL